MTDLPTIVRIGTRGSTLALRQTGIVTDLLRAVWPGIEFSTQVITTLGDQVTDVPLPDIGEQGVFTSSLERALRMGEIDLAVHSVKDLPTMMRSGAVIGAILERANPADVLISREGFTLATLPHGARVGTCSRRRAAQLRRLRPDLQPIDIRGNVDTRLAKAFAPDAAYDAIVLAHAGLDRLGRLEVISEILSLDVMLTAPGQAALGVQCRDEPQWLTLLTPLNHPETALSVNAERAFLSALGGGCSLPIAAYAHVVGDELHIQGRVIAPDGSKQVDAQQSFSTLNGDIGGTAGLQLAQSMKQGGALELLEHLQ